jgi:hypothetical protein
MTCLTLSLVARLATRMSLPHACARVLQLHRHRSAALRAYKSPAISLPDVPHACAQQRCLLILHVSYFFAPVMLRAIEPANDLPGEHTEVLCAFSNPARAMAVSS